MLNFLNRGLKVSLADLPVGAYIVSPEGSFLEANDEARRLLGLQPPPELHGHTISQFYADSKKRAGLQKKMETHGLIHNETVEFEVEGQSHYFQLNCRLFKYRKRDSFLGTIVDITSDYQYHKLFDHLPSGVYQLDSQDKIVRANLAFARLHGYERSEQLIGQPISQFYVNADDAKDVRDRVKRGEILRDHPVELEQKSGKRFFGQITAIRRSSPSGEYEGREGTVRDTTDLQRYERVLSTVPVGLYTADTSSSQDTIQHCNAYFARLHGFSDPKQLEGRNLRDFHADSTQTKDLLRSLEEAISTGKEVHKALKVNAKGEQKILDLRCLPLASAEGKLIGRTGAVQDVTEEQEMRQHIHKLTEEIGQVLHMYTSLLMGLHHRLLRWVELIGNDDSDLKSIPDEVTIVRKAKPYENSFLGSFSQLLEATTHVQILDSAQRGAQARLATVLDVLKTRDNLPLPQRLSTLRALALEARSLISILKTASISRSVWRDAETSALRLANFYTFIDMKEVYQTILGIDYNTNALRAYIFDGQREKEPVQALSISQVLTRSMMTLAEYARAREIAVIPDDRTSGAQVMGNEDALHRAVSNILHNAIKYSWATRKLNPKVDLSATVKGSTVSVEVSNIGVGIPESELESRAIFEFCQRGRWAGDQSRPGTGIGLADTDEIVRRHGGTLIIESTPLNRRFKRLLPEQRRNIPESGLRNYPFRTVCSITLPRGHKK